MDALLKEALVRRRARLPAETSCFRWIDGELPGVTIDLFADVAVVSFVIQLPDRSMGARSASVSCKITVPFITSLCSSL